MHFDLDTVREAFAWFVDPRVPARDHEQPCIAFEEKTARVRQQALLVESGDARRGKQKGFNHRCEYRSWEHHISGVPVISGRAIYFA